VKPTRILLDLDDVCNCFTLYALRHVGCPVGNHDYHLYDHHWGWDIVKAANHLHPDPGRHFTQQSFWESIKREHWSRVPGSPEFFPLLSRCISLVGRENVCILSCPTLDPDCLAGKLEWIQEFMPKDMQRQFLIGPRKHFCARPDALLIDDSDANVTAFREHGGQAILMPRPWNSLWGEPTELYVNGWLNVHFHGDFSCWGAQTE
jgi:hypothetical protein